MTREDDDTPLSIPIPPPDTATPLTQIPLAARRVESVFPSGAVQTSRGVHWVATGLYWGFGALALIPHVIKLIQAFTGARVMPAPQLDALADASVSFLMMFLIWSIVKAGHRL